VELQFKVREILDGQRRDPLIIEVDAIAADNDSETSSNAAEEEDNEDA
jgi:hypothetical protein